MAKIVVAIRYSRPLPEQAMKKLQEAVGAMKEACPDYYFFIAPESIRLEQIPETILLKAGYKKIEDTDRERSSPDRTGENYCGGG